MFLIEEKFEQSISTNLSNYTFISNFRFTFSGSRRLTEDEMVDNERMWLEEKDR